MAEYYDLGSYHRLVSTTSEEAQLWFDRGLVWCYGFNHEEAVRCFQRAAEIDPNCAIAFWGIAYAAGPNYNKQWKAFDVVDLRRSLDLAFTAARNALARLENAKSRRAGAHQGAGSSLPCGHTPDQVTPVWNDDYANAMRLVYRTHESRPKRRSPLRAPTL